MSYGRIVFLLRWGLDLRNGIRRHKAEGVFYRVHRVPISSIPSIPSTVKWQSFARATVVAQRYRYVFFKAPGV